MTRKIFPCLFIIALFLLSCDSAKKQEGAQNVNQLVVTSSGDSFETGFWTYIEGVKDVSKNGYYSAGFKVNEWLYKTNFDSAYVEWDIFQKGGVKFNIPSYFKIIENVKDPVLHHLVQGVPRSEALIYI